MKVIKIAVPAFLLFLFLSVSLGFGQTMTVQNFFFNYYNQFSLSDLGFVEGSPCRKTFFNLVFGGSSANNYFIQVEIEHASLAGGSSFGTVVSGETNRFPFTAKFINDTEGPQWSNCEISNDSELDFDADITNNAFESRYNRINGFPEGRYTVTITLTPETVGPTVARTITFNVKPYLLEYQSPRDGAMVAEPVFRFRTNLTNPVLHIRRILSGGAIVDRIDYELPGGAESYIPRVYNVLSTPEITLTEPGTYEWRVTGDQTETASTSLRYTEGQWMSFELVDRGEEDDIMSDLTEEQKDIIMAMLLQLLQKEGSPWYDTLVQSGATINDIGLEEDDGDGAPDGVSFGKVISILEQLQLGSFGSIEIR